MWILRSVNNSELTYDLLVGRDYTIGRRECDIIIPNDMSISRKHAVIRVLLTSTTQQDSIPSVSDKRTSHQVTTLQLQDVSKLGTQLKEERIANGAQRILNSGDSMIFGTAGISKYSVVYQPYIVTTSCLSSDVKKRLKLLIRQLGGHVTNDWTNECSLVVMSRLSVTIKVINALLSQKLIVTVQYLEDLVSSIESKTKRPDPNEYLPTLAESQINSDEVSFKENPQRGTLFVGKTFFFLSSEQLKRLQGSVELGGGHSSLLTMDSLNEALLLAEGSCVMACGEAELSQTTAHRSLAELVRGVLLRAKRRLIAESELGFAVLYCSVNEFCNADSPLSPASSVNTALHQTLSQALPPSSQSAAAQSHSAAASSHTAVQPEFVVPREVPSTAKQHQANATNTTIQQVQIKEEPLSQASLFDQSVMNVIPSLVTPQSDAPPLVTPQSDAPQSLETGAVPRQTGSTPATFSGKRGRQFEEQEQEEDSRSATRAAKQAKHDEAVGGANFNNQSAEGIDSTRIKVESVTDSYPPTSTSFNSPSDPQKSKLTEKISDKTSGVLKTSRNDILAGVKVATRNSSRKSNQVNTSGDLFPKNSTIDVNSDVIAGKAPANQIAASVDAAEASLFDDDDDDLLGSALDNMPSAATRPIKSSGKRHRDENNVDDLLGVPSSNGGKVIKVEDSENWDHTTMETTLSKKPRASEQINNAAVPAGFLSTLTCVQNRNVPVDITYVKEEDQPSHVTVVELCPLLSWKQTRHNKSRGHTAEQRGPGGPNF